MKGCNCPVRQCSRRRSLAKLSGAKLSGTIDDYLRPPEPTFPAWLSGLPRP
jgi:hypothetical protein